MYDELLPQPFFGDYDFLGEGGITDIPTKIEFITTAPYDDLDKYIIKDYEDLSLNLIKYPKENYIYEHNQHHEIVEIKNKYEYISPKSELLGQKLGKLVIQNFIQSPQINQNQKYGSLPPLPSFLLNGSNVQQPFGYTDFGATKPEDLPEMAMPVLEFMEGVQPHVVIGCDRGGRLFGLAMHAAWRQTRESQPFPTLDGKLHFARVSKSEDPDVLQQKIDQIIEASKQFGAQRGNEVSEGEQLRVLFVDDWIIGGGTMRLAQRMMKKHGAQTFFAVMCGEGADVTGQPNLHTSVSWHDRPEEIGVNYLSTIRQNPDGTISQQQEVVAVRGAEAVRNRQRIQQAAKALQGIKVLEKVA